MEVVIDIFEITGERVGRIRERRNGGPGQTLSTTWNAAGLAPGIYICHLKITDASGREVISKRKKIALVK